MAVAMMLVIVLDRAAAQFPDGGAVPWREVRALRAHAAVAADAGGAARRVYSGVFTPTEAAAGAALYALALASFVYRALGLRGLASVLAGSGALERGGRRHRLRAFVVNYALATEQMPERHRHLVRRLDLGPAGFLLVVNLVFLALAASFDITTLCSCWCRCSSRWRRAWAWTWCTSAWYRLQHA